MKKVPKSWENLYGAGSLGMGHTICLRGGSILTATACPTRGHWFEKFMRGDQVRIGVINKKCFAITCKVVKALLERCEE